MNFGKQRVKYYEEVRKMEEANKDLVKVVEVLQETKEGLEKVSNVEEIKITEEEKDNYEKNMKILEETEKKIDDLLEDLAK